MPTSKIEILKDRSLMFTAARRFFQEKGVCEVDCPAITKAASVDAHIDLIRVVDQSSYRYLHSSPEYCMKRLLSEGMGDIYQLGHVYREGEYSPKHNPEFTMAEWYRCGITFEAMIEETLEFIRLFLGNQPHSVISYREALLKHTGIDYTTASIQELLYFLKSKELIPYPGIEDEGKDAVLNIILGAFVEPHLGTNELTVLAYYPASQAALAKTRSNGEENVAERFEIYYKGIELCNGYHELVDPKEQRSRFEEANAFRIQLGKQSLPIDENFLQALEKGLPDSCGVAVGFDRLMMLRHGVTDIAEVIPFNWITA